MFPICGSVKVPHFWLWNNLHFSRVQSQGKGCTVEFHLIYICWSQLYTRGEGAPKVWTVPVGFLVFWSLPAMLRHCSGPSPESHARFFRKGPLTRPKAVRSVKSQAMGLREVVSCRPLSS
uniref:Uncharacterized protein n=1 Tax=Mus musculus TaxID=10090 RepID=Q3ULR9_MOUSE|nr:unnamed protein product [Mus musculus]